MPGALRPDLVIPFKLDKEAAKASLKAYYKGKKLLPRVFAEENHIDEIKGIYVPFWLFDTNPDANMRYRATRVRAWADAQYNYTETSYYSVLRGGNLRFEAVPVDGSTKMDDNIMESLEPFNLDDAVDFQTAYLAGYLADKYDVDAEQSIERANARIKSSTEQNFARTVVGYSSVMPEASNVRFNSGKARYAMYPVWLLNTTWNGQRYTFAMNGQTGKFVGDLPVDKKLFGLWFGGIAAGVSALVYGLSWLLCSM